MKMMKYINVDVNSKEARWLRRLVSLCECVSMDMDMDMDVH
jgi:hypothetical protein